MVGPTPSHPLKWSRVTVAGRTGILTKDQMAVQLAAVGGALEPRLHRLTTHLVIGMGRLPLRSDGQPVESVLRAERINAGRNRIRVISERAMVDLLQESGSGSGAALQESLQAGVVGQSRSGVCQLLGIDAETLRRWEQFGLVHGRDGRFDFQEVVAVRTVLDLLTHGVSLNAIAHGLTGLSRSLPEHDRPLAQMQWIAANQARVLTRFGGQLMDPSGQLLFDFDPPEGHSETSKSMSSESFGIDETPFERGQSLEALDRFDEAIAAYRQCVQADSSHAAAWFNLGNLLRAQTDDHSEALRCFEAAFSADGGMVEACYNAADLHWDVEAVDEAEAWLRRALDVAPRYADAHFNLAALLQDQGRVFEAAKHWRSYLDLDAEGPWSEEARRALAAVVTS